MKKAVIILSILAFIASGCGQGNSKKQTETGSNETVSGQNNKRKVKYFFQANGGSVIFFDDGTAYRCAQCDLDENLETYKPNITYKEFPTYLLMEGNMDWQLYDESGRIGIDWVIINYRPIKSVYQITEFQPHTQTISADSILDINETCLITIFPETKDFDNEESEEAQAYFTAMGDWAFYRSETSARFEEMGIKSIVPEQRYLSFTLTGNEKIIIDTQKEQNGESVNMLLYKKGQIPIIVYLILSDNDMESINDYLNAQ